MSLSDKARAAREHADVCLDRGCHAVALAMEGALAAEAREQLAELREEPDLSTFPTPAEAGYVSEVVIQRPETEN